jgi:hypothetical protein
MGRYQRVGQKQTESIYFTLPNELRRAEHRPNSTHLIVFTSQIYNQSKPTARSTVTSIVNYFDKVGHFPYPMGCLVGPVWPIFS